MYWEQSAVVRTELGTTIELEMKKVVRQGCVLTARLLNLYTGKGFIFYLISFFFCLFSTKQTHFTEEKRIIFQYNEKRAKLVN